MANTILGITTTAASEEAFIYLCKADDSISTSFSINWGDGSTAESYEATTSPVKYDHTYSAADSYNITITVSAGELKIQNIDISELAVSENVISLSTGDGLTVIGENAFRFWGDSDTTTLRTVTFGDALVELETQAFEYASGLETITIPPNVIIGDYAFSDIDGYNDESITVVIGAGCTIGEYAFGASSIESLTLSPGITTIGTNALANIDDLVDITIPSSVTYIGMNAFHNMYALESATIKPTTPPELEESGGEPQYPFDFGSIPIYVPRDSLTAYQTTPGWSDVAEYYVGADIDPDPDPEPTPPGPEPIILTGDKYLNDVGTMTLIGLIKYSLATKQDTIQVEEMAEPSEDFVGKVFQYMGETDSNFTNGFFYKCVSDGQTTPTYSWEVVNVNPVATTTTAGLMSAADKAKLDAITYATTADIDAMFE